MLVAADTVAREFTIPHIQQQQQAFHVQHSNRHSSSQLQPPLAVSLPMDAEHISRLCAALEQLEVTKSTAAAADQRAAAAELQAEQLQHQVALLQQQFNTWRGDIGQRCNQLAAAAPGMQQLATELHCKHEEFQQHQQRLLDRMQENMVQLRQEVNATASSQQLLELQEQLKRQQECLVRHTQLQLQAT
jgi:hypothetical protein